MSIPPCACADVRTPCESWNRTFRSQTCFDGHKTIKLREKTVCEQKRNCPKCGLLLSRKQNECFKTYCENCMANKEVGHLCCMKPLKNELPRSDDVLSVFCDFETTEDTKFTDTATQHVPNLVCLQQFCTQCEKQPDINVDCLRCGKRQHAFFEDPVADVLTYFCKPRPCCNKVLAIAHNAKAFDSHFILNRAALLKWRTQFFSEWLKNCLYEDRANDVFRFRFISANAIA
jgi:hypothetical protein